jgi:transcription antitermination factor NusG
MRWYVVRSKPNREEALGREIDARGFSAYYPHVRVRPANPRSRTNRPYFPGYLFVQAELGVVGQNAFAWMPHSQGLVTFGGEAAEVPEGMVQAIQRRVEQLNAAGGTQAADIEPGEAVTIDSGPFAGYKAIFDARVAGHERVRVLLRFLQVKLELPEGQVHRTKRC